MKIKAVIIQYRSLPDNNGNSYYFHDILSTTTGKELHLDYDNNVNADLMDRAGVECFQYRKYEVRIKKSELKLRCQSKATKRAGTPEQVIALIKQIL